MSGTATGLSVDGTTLTISDDDTASTGIELTLDPTRVTEQGGQQTVTVTAMLNAGAHTQNTVVQVTVAGDTATVGGRLRGGLILQRHHPGEPAQRHGHLLTDPGQ